MSPDAAKIDESKIYVVKGATLKKLLDGCGKITGTKNQIDVSEKPDGTRAIGFAKAMERTIYVTINGVPAPLIFLCREP